MSTIVVIDGSNVARCASWRAHVGRGASDHDVRRALVDAVAGWIARAPDADAVHLVFDGAGPWSEGETQITPAVTVVGSGKRSGDDVVIAIARDGAARADVLWVVSSDREVRDIAGASAHRDLDADAFVRVVLGSAARAAGAEVEQPEPPPLRRGIAELVNDDVRAKLERLRRGE